MKRRKWLLVAGWLPVVVIVGLWVMGHWWHPMLLWESDRGSSTYALVRVDRGVEIGRGALIVGAWTERHSAMRGSVVVAEGLRFDMHRDSGGGPIGFLIYNAQVESAAGVPFGWLGIREHIHESARLDSSGKAIGTWYDGRYWVIPMWLVSAVAIGVACIAWWRHRRWLATYSLQHCLKCGYDLSASTAKCPECGRVIPKKAS